MRAKPERTCEQCGGVIGRATQARYCSPECKRAAYLERRRKGELANTGTAQRIDATCGQCGKPFQAERAAARFCSVACRQAHYREANAERLERERERERRRRAKALPGTDVRRMIDAMRGKGEA